MNICIYGASSSRIDDIYFEKTFELGKMIAERGHNLIFGGGNQGVMGACARGVSEGSRENAGGKIIGIAPKFFDLPDVLYPNCDELILVNTMQERKALFFEKSDAFIVCPGGNGTYEEFFETFTLRQLGQLNAPICLYSIDGYFNPLKDMLEKGYEKNFIKNISRQLYKITDDLEDVFDYIENDRMPLMDLIKMKY